MTSLEEHVLFVQVACVNGDLSAWLKAKKEGTKGRAEVCSRMA
jgi:hypothetical protein